MTRVYLRVLFFCIVLFLGFISAPPFVNAHSPHDVIDALEISPTFKEDQTLFIILKNTWVLKSIDGGYSWKYLNNGIDNQYLLISMSISPSFKSDGTIFITSLGDGIFRSNDGGRSWERNNNGLKTGKIKFVKISPNFMADKTAYSAGADGGLYKTDNGGQSWKQVMDDQTTITAIEFYPGRQNEAVFVGDQGGVLYSLGDGGRIQELARLQNSGAITCIGIVRSGESQDTIYLGTEKDGLYASAGTENSFIKVNSGADAAYVTSIGIVENDQNAHEIYVASWNQALYKSADGAASWIKKNRGLTTDRQADSEQYKSPHFRDIRISPNFLNDRTMFLAGFDGLFKTEDGAETWMQMETMPVKLIKGFALSAQSQNSNTIAVTTYGGGAYISEDKGISWQARNAGLRGTRLSDVVFSPAYVDDHKIFTASSSYFLVSSDKGKNWRKTLVKERSWQTKVYRLLVRAGISHEWLENKVFRRTNIITVWPNVLVVSPNFHEDQTLYFGCRYHGFFRSHDGGGHFAKIWDEIDGNHDGKITSLDISPNFKNDQTLFAGIRWEGIYRTENGGLSWENKSAGIEFLEEAKSVVPSYYFVAISPNYKNDRTVIAGTDSGVFKTENGGTEWRRLDVIGNKSPITVKAIAISPNYEKDGTLIASINGKGLFKSTDRGSSWQAIGMDLTENNHLLEFIEFSNRYEEDQTIWAASREAAFTSTDEGNTWSQIDVSLARYENNRDVIVYQGRWKNAKGDQNSAGSASYSEDREARATLRFVGTGVRWIGNRSEKHGIAKVYLDGDLKADVDQFSLNKEFSVTLYEANDLKPGPHVITVQSGFQENQQTGRRWIDLDAFEVIF